MAISLNLLTGKLRSDNSEQGNDTESDLCGMVIYLPEFPGADIWAKCSEQLVWMAPA